MSVIKTIALELLDSIALASYLRGLCKILVYAK